MITESLDLTTIHKQELFSNLKKEEIDFVISHSGVLNLPKNGVLFTSGEKAARFYILTSGEIRVFKKTDDGGEEEMAQFTSGDTIGDFDFARGAVYDASAEAAKDSHLIVFPGTDSTLDSLASQSPSIVCSIMLNAIIMMTGRIKSTNKLVLDNMSWVQDIHRRAYEDAGTGLWKQALIADEIIGKLKSPAALIMIKPDRFKILVDSRGHSAGDEAMIKIALILKNICRQTGEAWPLRFKSNEVGIIINDCNADAAEHITKQLAIEIAGMEKVPAMQIKKSDGTTEEADEFHFSATVSWCIWPLDGENWDNLFQGNYANLLDTWKASGDTIIHFTGQDKP
ncbi:MAG: cyclic nucleotide-binding domain-containing protein [Treponema sp.]|nr:cyclic nucleotide-binding domain-containing protein [Treponema sp.]